MFVWQNVVTNDTFEQQRLLVVHTDHRERKMASAWGSRGES